MTLLCLLSLTALGYTYLVYPLLLTLRSGNKIPSQRSTHHIPSASLLVSLYNEENSLPEKLQNSRALTYPRLRLIFGSDGSTDQTNNLLQEATQITYSLCPRQGKTATLNQLAQLARSEILVFSDANTLLEADALSALIAPFANPRVGLVCGNIVLHPTAQGPESESLYWRYERWIKQREGAFGCLLGASGGLYAIRAALFAPLDPNTRVDDLAISAHVLQQGYQAVYAKDARAHETSEASTRDEFRRRSRIGAGNLQFFLQNLSLLSPRNPTLAFVYISHKVLRWLGPLWLLIAFFSNLACISQGPLFQWLFFVQCILYTLAALNLGRLSALCRHFVAMNAALGWGYLTAHRQGVGWSHARTSTKSSIEEMPSRISTGRPE